MKNDSAKSDTTETAAPPIAKKKSMLQSPREKKIAGTSGGLGTLVGVLLMVIINVLSGPAVNEQTEQPAGEEVVASASSDTTVKGHKTGGTTDNPSIVAMRNGELITAVPIVSGSSDTKTGEPVAKKDEPAAKTVVPDIVAGLPDAKTDEPATAEEELASITLSGDEYTKFVSYKLLGGTDNLSAIARELASIGGVDHEEDSKKGDLVIFSRTEKPSQTVTKISVTAKGITVVFREDPSPKHLEAVAKTLVTASKSLGVKVGETWQGQGTSRTFAAIAATDK